MKRLPRVSKEERQQARRELVVLLGACCVVLLPLFAAMFGVVVLFIRVVPDPSSITLIVLCLGTVIIAWFMLLVPVWYLLIFFLSYFLPLDEYIALHHMPVPAGPLMSTYYRVLIKPVAERILEMKIKRRR